MGIIERKLKEKARRKATIIKAAKKVIIKYGVNNASIDMISKEAQFSKGTIYLYFKSKDDLYLSMVEETLSELLKLFTNKTKNIDDPIEALIQTGLAYLEYARNYPEFFKIIYSMDFSELINAEAADETTIEKYRITEGALFNIVVDCVNRCKKLGYFPQTVNAGYLTAQLWLCSSGILNMMLRKDRPDLLHRIEVEKIIKDNAKNLIIAYSNNQELINKLKEEVYQSYPDELPIQTNQTCCQFKI